MELVQRLRSYLPEGDGTLWSRSSKDMALAADLIEKQAAELEAARAEIERKMGAGRFVLEQLAAEQAKNVGLQELVEHFALIDLGRSFLPGDFRLWVVRARKAISAPSDTSSLEAIVKKACEVMRERSINVAWNNEPDCNGPIEMGIRALPVVTLEDLK